MHYPTAVMKHQDTKTPREPLPEETNRIAREVVDSAFAVHTTLGPGLIESVYEACLVHELHRRGFNAERQLSLPVVYQSLRLDAGLRLDMVVERCVVVELKAVEAVLPVHKAQPTSSFLGIDWVSLSISTPC